MQDNQQENCPSCHKVFNDKSKLKAHERQVHQANPVPCEVCGEVQFNKYIVFEHLSEYFELSEKTLRKKTDQTVEATHSKFDNFIRAHNYKIRDVESEKAGEYLLKAVKHFNSYNLGKID